MSHQISAKNDGSLRFTVTHTAQGATVSTDAPAGHGGEGLTFAPTELLDAALATCTGANISAKAKLLGLDAAGLTIGASHVMIDGPRRIGSVELDIAMPFDADERRKKSLIATAKACPVRNTLRAETQIKMTFHWPDGSVDVIDK